MMSGRNRRTLEGGKAEIHEMEKSDGKVSRVAVMGWFFFLMTERASVKLWLGQTALPMKGP